MSVRDLINSGFVLALAFLSTARSVQADRDGYYCTGPSYIAFELSPRHPMPAHVLYVVSLRDSGGIAPPTTLELPRFQVHGMRCGASSVQLLGWDSLYTVTLGDSRLSLVASVAPWAKQTIGRQLPVDYSTLNLGPSSRAAVGGQPDTVALPIQSTAYKFILTFNVRLAPCTYRVVTRLVELDAASHAVAVLTLFDADTPRACGPG